ncbi:MAG TPA: PLDc N-terminal domain-containing protein [Ktedonobacterales bacterium]|nr:PLDc N-terminal domain-containing protein [Ktedonobacterales bacterium]
MARARRGQVDEFAKEAWRVSTYSRSNSSNDLGCLLTTLIVAVCLFVPLVGHIFLTVMIIGDDLSSTEKLLWLLLVWLVPVAGPLLYLLLGQRRNRLL